MDAGAARRRFAGARVARLATVGIDGWPHLVPLVFAVAGDTIYSAVDAKPKRTAALRRLANARANPQVCVLADHYDDADWTALWWVRADGTARILECPGGSSLAESANAGEASRAVDALAAKYPQYHAGRPSGPVLAIDVARWVGWSGV